MRGLQAKGKGLARATKRRAAVEFAILFGAQWPAAIAL
jgi:hypothetical protein